MILRVRILWIFFATLSAAQAQHLEMALVLDRGQYRILPDRLITEGAHLATQELESKDRVTVITFASGIKVNLPFSGNLQEISRAIGGAVGTSVVWPGKPRLYDAIFMALQQFPTTAEPGVKRVVAVITNVSMANCQIGLVPQRLGATGTQSLTFVWILSLEPNVSRIRWAHHRA